MADSQARDEQMIAALKRERAAYVARGMDDRVAQVDDQLKHYGHDPVGEETPQGRKGPSQAKQTADNGSQQGGQDPNAPKGRTTGEEAKATGGEDSEAAKRGPGRPRSTKS